ncbi:synapse-associated protein of 47 kDa-like isoform X3 [Penaeus japonicus]|uniref:synapse-associated protein of 47 kDa-like isoform X3 n=1 Tax=Penaeus japonicus TaxID=27405 RepID=UPI001C70F6AD|nr:synapse-associated protein of 47 kDa-like isoform X3 [Penaeus japonicus]
MNMFSNMSTQVSGLGSSLGSWFKKEGGKEEGAEGQEGQEVKKEQTSPQEQHSPASANASEQSVKGSADENEDAASQHSGKPPSAVTKPGAPQVAEISATEGADSNPPSEAEEEPESKAGFASAVDTAITDVSKAIEAAAGYGRSLESRMVAGWQQMAEGGGLSFNLSAVQGKASAGAKTVGSFFSSAFSKAGASVKEASSKIKESVEKNTLLSEFNKEQEAFIKAKGGKGGEALPPWVGYPDEEGLKEEILALSTDRRNFVRSPPTGVSFEFELEAFLPVAQATLAADPNLEKMRFELVPKTINEETFWRNYFYRVGLIRQSTELSTLEREGVDAASKTTADGERGSKGKDDDVDHPDSPSHGGESEFVSDSFQPSSKDLEEVKRGISNLTKPSDRPIYRSTCYSFTDDDEGLFCISQTGLA